MRITRFVNGKKIEKQTLGETVISNDLISGTIAKVNKRIVEHKRKDRISLDD